MIEVEDIVDAIDIREYISQYVDLEKRKDGYWGLSPFTDERTPSFHIDLNDDCFYDFSSHIGGNVFNFVKEYNHCTGSQAFNILKDYAGFDDKNVSACKRLEATKICKRFKVDNREKPKNISKYAPDVMDIYELRWDKLNVWMKEGISSEALKKFNVRYDGLSNRLVYPIKDLKGRIVNIGGRTLDPEYKEKGCRKYTYFGKWGSMDAIYGLYENMEAIKKAGEVIVFEGCKSVLLAETWGIKNTAAVLTSRLNKNQFQQLISIGVRVIFALDKEIDITLDKNIRSLRHYTEVYYLRDLDDLLDEKDAPVDKGKDIFLKLYGERRRYR